jgi:hypothetical protein
VQETAKRVLALVIDPETPEIHAAPKAPPLGKPQYTRWVKQAMYACGNPADDPHRYRTWTRRDGNKAHDLFVLPLCRAHHVNYIGTLWLSKPNMAVRPLLFRFLER